MTHNNKLKNKGSFRVAQSMAKAVIQEEAFPTFA